MLCFFAALPRVLLLISACLEGPKETEKEVTMQKCRPRGEIRWA